MAIKNRVPYITKVMLGKILELMEKFKKCSKKKLVATVTACGLIFTVTLASNTDLAFAATGTVNPKETVVYLRPGEYPNKPGKVSTKETVKAAGVDSSKYHLYEEGEHSEVGGLGEFEINKKITAELKESIERSHIGVKVIIKESTSAKDDLNAAGQLAADSNADVMMSLHTNCSNGNAKGTIFFTPVNQKGKGSSGYTYDGKFQSSSEALAKSAVDGMSELNHNTNGLLTLFSNPLQSDSDHKYGELNVANNKMPCFIIEAGFFDNSENLKGLTNENAIKVFGTEVSQGFVSELTSGKYDNDQDCEKEASKEATKEEIEGKADATPEATEDKAVENAEQAEEESSKEAEDLPVIDDLEDVEGLEPLDEKEAKEVNKTAVKLGGRTYEIERVESNDEMSDDEINEMLDAEIEAALN